MPTLRNHLNCQKDWLGRWFIRRSANPRPSSYPYLSGDTFRAMTDHVFEGSTLERLRKTGADSRTEKIKANQLVFVKIDWIRIFFEKIHLRIGASYVLITHNGDKNVKKELVKYLDKKIVRWYGQNVEVHHPKITPLPIGLENLHYYSNGITKIFDRLKRIARRTPKKNRILYGFKIENNPVERQKAVSALRKNKCAEPIKTKLDSRSYLKKLLNYKFVASPPGNGIDCHRTWEALYLGVVPIVKRSAAMEYFLELGIPLWIIDDWKEVERITQEQLAEKYRELRKGFDEKLIYADYWIDKINNEAAANSKQ